MPRRCSPRSLRNQSLRDFSSSTWTPRVRLSKQSERLACRARNQKAILQRGSNAWYTKSEWSMVHKVMLVGQLQARDSKLFNLVGDAVWCDPRSMVEDHLENWCTTTFFAHLHRRHLDAAMNSAARVWPAKTVSGLQLPLRTSVWPTSKVLILLKVSLIVLVGPRQLRLDPGSRQQGFHLLPDAVAKVFGLPSICFYVRSHCPLSSFGSPWIV